MGQNVMASNTWERDPAPEEESSIAIPFFLHPCQAAKHKAVHRTQAEVEERCLHMS